VQVETPSRSLLTQFLDLTCGKTSFWGYPQPVRITLISAGAGNKALSNLLKNMLGKNQGGVFSSGGDFLRATCQTFQQLIILGVYFLKCLQVIQKEGGLILPLDMCQI